MIVARGRDHLCLDFHGSLPCVLPWIVSSTDRIKSSVQWAGFTVKWNFSLITTDTKPFSTTGCGCYTKVLGHVHLVLDAAPKFIEPRAIVFAYPDGVKEEIHRNVVEGILQYIETSPWAVPTVPICKPSGEIRNCDDFDVTINPPILVGQHPIPSIDELLICFNNGEKFTKLDFSDTYLQIELDKESKRLVVMKTPMDLFRYTCMPFSIVNAPTIFQRIIDQFIAGIPNYAAFLNLRSSVFVAISTNVHSFNTKYRTSDISSLRAAKTRITNEYALFAIY